MPMEYRPDEITDPLDFEVLMGSGPEPVFDPVLHDFLCQGLMELRDRCAKGSLLQFASLGLREPWLYRLTFGTRGHVRTREGDVQTVERHVIILRFLPDYLRNANRFDMLRLIEPIDPPAFHPNISSVGHVCVEIYPGEPLVSICESLHNLLRWKLRQYDERNAFNKIACAWGRDHVHEPIDDRPLFGRKVAIQWESVESKP